MRFNKGDKVKVIATTKQLNQIHVLRRYMSKNPLIANILEVVPEGYPKKYNKEQWYELNDGYQYPESFLAEVSHES